MAGFFRHPVSVAFPTFRDAKLGQAAPREFGIAMKTALRSSENNCCIDRIICAALAMRNSPGFTSPSPSASQYMYREQRPAQGICLRGNRSISFSAPGSDFSPFISVLRFGLLLRLHASSQGRSRSWICMPRRILALPFTYWSRNRGAACEHS